LALLLCAPLWACSRPDRPPGNSVRASTGGEGHRHLTLRPSPRSSSKPKKSSRDVIEHVFPLKPASVVDYGPGHHDYPATDVFAPIGTRFVAVTSGVVDYVSRVDSWRPEEDDPATRGGLSVAIVGDDRVRYYGSHLSEVADGIYEGRRVEAGELLGLVGTSGNARGTSPHLHFGVSRPTYSKDWETRRGEVDTYPLLRAWQSGRNVIPKLPS
jgi:murein DD-endopeptidase MepM/ murein hydrolase activator NlpD